MSITGFTVIRNGNKLGYPWLESILCVLDRVDNFVLGEGYSDDDTWDWCQRLNHRYPKVKIFRQFWPRSVTGFAIGKVTNEAMDYARTLRSDFLWLVQSDELYHPYAARRMVDLMDADSDIDGIEVNFLHLQNNYQQIQDGAGYQRAIRAVRNKPYIHSYRDAWTFEGCRNVTRVELDYPVVHANRTYWRNIPLKMRSHFDELYPDLPHYKVAAEDAEKAYRGEEPDLFKATTSPFAKNLPEIILPTLGWSEYHPRGELLAA